MHIREPYASSTMYVHRPCNHFGSLRTPVFARHDERPPPRADHPPCPTGGCGTQHMLLAFRIVVLGLGRACGAKDQRSNTTPGPVLVGALRTCHRASQLKWSGASWRAAQLAFARDSRMDKGVTAGPPVLMNTVHPASIAVRGPSFESDPTPSTCAWYSSSWLSPAQRPPAFPSHAALAPRSSWSLALACLKAGLAFLLPCSYGFWAGQLCSLRMVLWQSWWSGLCDISDFRGSSFRIRIQQRGCIVFPRCSVRACNFANPAIRFDTVGDVHF